MVSYAQRSFAGGEISPAVYGRVDQAKYQTGLRTCRNFIVQRFGGATNRPGTKYVGEVKTSANFTKLIPFIFNETQAYVLELGPIAGGGGFPAWVAGYMRVHRLGATIAPPTVAAWDIATAYEIGDYVLLSGTTYVCVAANTGNTPPDADYWYPMPAGILEVPTPWAITETGTIKIAQSADIITVCAEGIKPYRIERYGADLWRVVEETWTPEMAAPTGVTNSGAAGSVTQWVVTAIQQDTLIESLASSTTTSADTPSSGSPITVSWTAQPEAEEFAVYKGLNGTFGFIGTARGTSFVDVGYEPDTSLTPPIARDVADIIGVPAVPAYFQQRLILGGGVTYPERIVASRVGDFRSFSISSPLQDDDSLTIPLSGSRVSQVRNLIGIGNSLVCLTSGVEYTIGAGDQALTPQTISAVPQSYSGSSWLDVLPVVDTALYVQARGSIVRDLQYEFATDGYRGRDLTVYAQHLVDGYTIADWDYAQTPNSVVWACRSDGTLLGLTYVREHDVWGWHRHDTGAGGLFEQVVVIPEGNEDAVYCIVQRTIDGSQARYVERFATRQFTDLAVDAVFVDCAGTYDGRNTTATTMTLSGGTTWAFTEDLTLTASAGFFVSGDVGNAIHLTVGDETIRCRIISYSSTTVVTVQANRDVPAAFRSVAISSWAKAVDELTGLSWLEGETVSILADGFVQPQAVVTSGAVTLSRPFSVIHVGIPIEADLETLSLEQVQGESLIDKKKRVKGVTLLVQTSQSFYAGTGFDALRETKLRATEGYDEPIDPVTGPVEVLLNSTWDDNGRVAIRQSDPLPLTVLSIVPSTVVVA